MHDDQQQGGGIGQVDRQLAAAAALAGQQRRADGADRRSFRRRRDAHQRRAEHRDQQHDGRHQHTQQRGQRHRPALLRRQRRPHRRPPPAECGLIQRIHRRQHQPRDHRPGIEVADGDGLDREDALRELRLLIGRRQHLAQDDQHRRRRDDLPERAGGADAARGEARLVAVPHHGRQRDQPHGDDGGTHHARGRPQQRADQGDGDGEAPAHAAEQAAHGFDQLGRDVRTLEHQPHEDEERDRDQRVAGHGAEDALRQRAQQKGIEGAQQRAEPAEENGAAGQHEDHGDAGKNEGAEPDHHPDVQPESRPAHASPTAWRRGKSCVASPRSAATARISTETDCSPSSPAITRINALR